MGSTFKSAVLNEKTSHALKQWHAGAKNRIKKRQEDSKSVHYISYISTSPIWTSNRTSTSQDLSPHRRTPTLGEITTFPEKSEITEDDHHGSTSVGTSKNEVQIEIP